MRFVDRYLSELIDYSGQPFTRAEAILDMQRMGVDQPCIDRWLQGYEHRQRLLERRQRVPVKLYLQSASKTARREA